MYNYTAYGLSIDSELVLPELQPLSKLDIPADLTIRLGTINWDVSEPDNSGRYFQVNREEAYLYWEVVGKFWVRSGKEIIVEPVKDASTQIVRLPLLSSVLAIVMHQRQHLVFHASAVAIHNQAAIFLGPKGQGKSTMVAALCGQGHQLLTDDVTALAQNALAQNALAQDNGSGYAILPGYPQIKLFPEAAQASLGDNPATLSRLHPEVEKLARPIPEHFWKTALPLKRIYILAEGATPEIESLGSQTAMARLIGNSYIPYLLGQQFLQSADAAWHMRQCASLAQSVPIYRLVRPRNLDLLPLIAQMVEADVISSVQLTMA
jgi:hypothetical protein